MSERPRPNFLLLYQADNPNWRPSDEALSGGHKTRARERPWQVVGLFYDEDEAFAALGEWRPGLGQGTGQLTMAQLSGLSFGDVKPDDHGGGLTSIALYQRDMVTETGNEQSS